MRPFLLLPFSQAQLHPSIPNCSTPPPQTMQVGEEWEALVRP